MTLAQWMKSQGLTDADMAARLNRVLEARDELTESCEINYRTVQKWRSGKRVPRPESIRLIFDVTGGKVDANSFCGLCPRSEKSPAI